MNFFANDIFTVKFCAPEMLVLFLLLSYTFYVTSLFISVFVTSFKSILCSPTSAVKIQLIPCQQAFFTNESW